MSSPAGSPSGARVFYRYEDAQGVVHLVDSPSDVPRALAGKAQRIELGPPPAAPATRASEATRLTSAPANLDWLSFSLGLGAGLLLAVTLFLVRGARPVTKVAISLAMIALLGSVVGAAYLGYLRRETGQSSAALGSPAEVVNDARKAVESMENRQKEQERMLEEIKREAR